MNGRLTINKLYAVVQVQGRRNPDSGDTEAILYVSTRECCAFLYVCTRTLQ